MFHTALCFNTEKEFTVDNGLSGVHAFVHFYNCPGWYLKVSFYQQNFKLYYCLNFIWVWLPPKLWKSNANKHVTNIMKSTTGKTQNNFFTTPVLQLPTECKVLDVEGQNCIQKAHPDSTPMCTGTKLPSEGAHSGITPRSWISPVISRLLFWGLNWSKPLSVLAASGISLSQPALHSHQSISQQPLKNTGCGRYNVEGHNLEGEEVLASGKQMSGISSTSSRLLIWGFQRLSECLQGPEPAYPVT